MRTKVDVEKFLFVTDKVHPTCKCVQFFNTVTNVQINIWIFLLTARGLIVEETQPLTPVEAKVF